LTTILGAAILATGIPVLAQTATNDQGTNATTTTTTPQYGKRGHRHGMHFQKMAEKLNLSQQQQEQLKPMFQQSREQAKAIRNDASLTPEQKKQKFEALRESTKAQMNGVLSPDQQKQLAELREQGKARMAERRAAMGKRMAEKLNLSQQQQD